MMKKFHSVIILLVTPIFLFGNDIDLDSLVKLGKSQYQKSPVRAIEITREILAKTTNPFYIGEAKYIEGLISRDVNKNYSEALKLFYSSVDHFIKAKSQKGIAKNIKKIGLCFYLTSNYGYALEYFYEELLYRKNLGEKIYLADAYFNLGLSHLQLGSHEKSIKYLDSAQVLYSELDRSSRVGECLLSTAIAYNNLNSNFNYIAQSTLHFAHEHDLRYLEGLVYSNLGVFSLRDSSYNIAINYMMKAEENEVYSKSSTNLINLYFNIAVAQDAIAENELAIKYAEQATNFEMKSTNQEVLLDSFELLIELYEKNGLHEMVPGVKSRLADVIAPLAKQAIEQKKMHEAYKTRMVKHQREKQLLEREKLQLENTRLYLIMGLLVTAMVAYFIIQRLYRRKRSKEDTIAYLKEKDAMLIHVTRKYNIDTAKIARELNEEYGRGFQTFGPD